MFRGNKMRFEIFSPIKGKKIPLREINDEMFSKKILGDGFAVLSSSNIVTSPIDGTISSLFESKHAIGITNSNGVEILIHVGLETVSLQGKGFKSFVKQNDRVLEGDKLLKVDFDLLEEKGLDCHVILVVINKSSFEKYAINIDSHENEPVICLY